MKTSLILIAAMTLLSCDATKRHQRLVRKHPHLLETISTPKQDTVRIEHTKYVECPDGSVITVNCDTVVIVKTETIQLPPTNAQIRQQERSKRNFEDNMRRMYQDSLKHAKRMYKLENKRLIDKNKTLRDLSDDTVKVARNEARGRQRGAGAFMTGLGIFGLFVLSLVAYKLFKK